MITYTWIVEEADCIISQNGLDKIIQTVYWRYRGEDENGTVYEPSGAQMISPPDPNTFMDFPAVTTQTVIGWLEALMDIPALQASIESRIQELNNPVIVRLQIPE